MELDRIDHNILFLSGKKSKRRFSSSNWICSTLWRTKNFYKCTYKSLVPISKELESTWSYETHTFLFLPDVISRLWIIISLCVHGTRVCTYMWFLFLLFSLSFSAFVSLSVFVSLSLCVYMHVYVCEYICVYMYMCLYIYVCMDLNMCVCFSLGVCRLSTHTGICIYSASQRLA